MRPSRLLLLIALLLLAACRPEPVLPLPTPIPRAPVPLSARALTPENARLFEPLQCLQKGAASAAAFSPDGSLLAIGAGSNITIHDAHSLGEIRLIEQQPPKGYTYAPGATALAFSSDGTLLAAGTDIGEVALFDPQTGTLLHTRRLHYPYKVIAIAFSANGRTVVSAGWDSKLWLWHVAGDSVAGPFYGPRPRKLYYQPSCSMPAAFSPDGALLAWACDRDLGLYRVQDGVRLRPLPIPEPVLGLAFSMDGTLLAASTSKRVRLWQFDGTGGLSYRDLSRGAPLLLAFSPDAQLLAITGGTGANVRRTSDGKNLQGWSGVHNDRTGALAFAPDGSYFVTGAADGQHCFWGLQP